MTYAWGGLTELTRIEGWRTWEGLCLRRVGSIVKSILWVQGWGNVIQMGELQSA